MSYNDDKWTLTFDSIAGEFELRSQLKGVIFREYEENIQYADLYHILYVLTENLGVQFETAHGPVGKPIGKDDSESRMDNDYDVLRRNI